VATFPWQCDTTSSIAVEEARMCFKLALVYWTLRDARAFVHLDSIEGLNVKEVPPQAAQYLALLVRGYIDFSTRYCDLVGKVATKPALQQQNEKLLATVLVTLYQNQWQKLHLASSSRAATSKVPGNITSAIPTDQVDMPELVRPLRHLVFAITLAIESLVEWHVCRSILADPGKSISPYYDLGTSTGFGGATYVGLILSRMERYHTSLAEAQKAIGSRKIREQAVTTLIPTRMMQAMAAKTPTATKEDAILQTMLDRYIGPLYDATSHYNQSIAHEPKPPATLSLLLSPLPESSRPSNTTQAGSPWLQRMMKQWQHIKDLQAQSSKALPTPVKQWIDVHEEALYGLLLHHQYTGKLSPALQDAIRLTLEEEAPRFYDA
jgi:hypothetical protein